MLNVKALLSNLTRLGFGEKWGLRTFKVCSFFSNFAQYILMWRENMNNKNKGQDYDRYDVAEESMLLDWLLRNVKGKSRNKLKDILRGHGVYVNGKCITRFDYQLVPGMKVTVSRTKKADPFKSRYIKIVYEDRYLIIVDKSAGVLSMAAGQSSVNVKSILDSYLENSGQKCRAHVVHRLDRETSGLLVYAKDMETEQILERNWHDMVYDRRYVAVVSGEIVDEGGTISSWLKDNSSYVTYSSPVDNGGKYAVTHFHVLNRTTTHSLVEYKLETGRKNQIRVHSADIGHPVCGDLKYGNGDNPIGRLCLHAYMLCFYHPVTRERMEFNTPIPQTFKQLFK